MNSVRLRTIAELEALAGPVGPLGTLEWFDEHQAELAAGAPQWLLDGLIDVLTDRPVTSEDWSRVEFVAAELLTAMGRERDLVDDLRPLLDVPSARPAIIDVFGGLADPRTAPDLVRLHAGGDLTTDELLRLVDALGAIAKTGTETEAKAMAEGTVKAESEGEAERQAESEGETKTESETDRKAESEGKAEAMACLRHIRATTEAPEVRREVDIMTGAWH